MNIKEKIIDKDFLKQYMMIIALIIIWAIFSIMTKGTFLSPRNISNLFNQSVFIMFLAMGVVLVIISGQIDLSVGSIVGLAGGLIAILDVWETVNPFLAIFITLIVGVLLGLWNGLWVAYFKMPSFIVTLGGLLIFRGILVGITKGTTIGPMSEVYKVFGKKYMSNWFGLILGIMISLFIILIELNNERQKRKYGLKTLPIYKKITKILFYIIIINLFIYQLNLYHGISIGILVVFFFIALFVILAKSTVFGRSVYAIGGNREGARLSGINIKKVTIVVFMISGFMAALAGIFITSRLNAASVATGQSAELDAIAACVIGGTSLMGGIGSVIGAIIGAIVMGSLDNGMSLLNVPSFWQSIVKGLVLIVALAFDIASKRQSK